VGSVETSPTLVAVLDASALAVVDVVSVPSTIVVDSSAPCVSPSPSPSSAAHAHAKNPRKMQRDVIDIATP
jgi:hypothetical protein